MHSSFSFYSDLARAIDAYHRCIENGNPHSRLHEERITKMVRDYLPHGSGFDAGCSIDLDASNSQKIVVLTSYHHMNEGGYYDGWSSHTVIVKPCLMFGFDIKITGRDRNDIKEYIASRFIDFHYNPVTK